MRAVLPGHTIAAEVGVVIIDAGIHDGDLYAGAIETKRVLNDVRAGHLNCRFKFRIET